MSSIAVLVNSFDGFSDLWEPFFTLFFRYWPDCPYSVYLTANHMQYPDSRVRTIQVGDDQAWSDGLISALDVLDTPYVLLLLEDYLIEGPVNTKRIERLFEYMRANEAVHLRLRPSPPPDVPCTDHPELGEVAKGVPYRFTTQAAIWDREVLLSLLKSGESGWEAEMNASQRANAVDRPFLSIRKGVAWPIPYYWYTGVVKGTWCRDAVALCRREGIEVDLEARALEPWSRYFVHKLEEKAPAVIRAKWWLRATVKRLVFNIRDLATR
jgi:hypothetical protein